MAEGLKFRNQTNTKFGAQVRESSRALASDRIRAASEFRMRLEREVIVDFENDDVDSLLREGFKVLTERIERSIGVVVEQVYSAPRFRML